MQSPFIQAASLILIITLSWQFVAASSTMSETKSIAIRVSAVSPNRRTQVTKAAAVKPSMKG